MATAKLAAAIRVGAATVGLAALLVGAGTVVFPAIEEAIPVADAADALGNDYLLIAVVGAVAFVVALVALARRAAAGIAEAEPPAVEQVRHRSLGTDFDAELESLPAVRTTDRHVEIRRRLREATIGALVACRGCSRAEARDRVDDGSWTTESGVAGFLAGDSFDPPPAYRRLLSGLRGDDWFRRRVQTTVNELEKITEGTRPTAGRSGP